LKYDDASFIEQVQLDGFDFEEAFADVIVSGRKRVLNISKPSQFNAAYDITRKFILMVQPSILILMMF